MFNDVFPILVTPDCDEAIERLRGAGVTVTEQPADQPWGERFS